MIVNIATKKMHEQKTLLCYEADEVVLVRTTRHFLVGVFLAKLKIITRRLKKWLRKSF